MRCTSMTCLPDRRILLYSVLKHKIHVLERPANDIIEKRSPVCSQSLVFYSSQNLSLGLAAVTEQTPNMTK